MGNPINLSKVVDSDQELIHVNQYISNAISAQKLINISDNAELFIDPNLQIPQIQKVTKYANVDMFNDKANKEKLFNEI